MLYLIPSSAIVTIIIVIEVSSAVRVYHYTIYYWYQIPWAHQLPPPLVGRKKTKYANHLQAIRYYSARDSLPKHNALFCLSNFL